MVTLLVAGHETTATALAWTLDLLTQHPSAMTALVGALDGLGPDPTPARIAALPYLDAVIRESLRLRPVVPMIGRTFRDSVRIDGYDLPAGQTVMGSIYLAQRRGDVFPEPDAFRPERFLGGLPTPFEWFPFGGGIRKCLGMAFALYEMKMVLATLLGEVTVRAASRKPTGVVRRSITLAPAEGLPLVLTRRAYAQRRGSMHTPSSQNP
jgi:cytochrome P450